MDDNQEYLDDAVSIRIEAFGFALKAAGLFGQHNSCDALIEDAADIEAFLAGTQGSLKSHVRTE